MENISPITDNVSIPEWAAQIREIKIRELSNLIGHVEKEVKENVAVIHPLVYIHYKNRITELKKKLVILQTK
jgi:hypothetical protein